MFDQGAALDHRHGVIGMGSSHGIGDIGVWWPERPASGTMDAMSKKNAGAKDKANGGGTIALNKRARHEYHLEERFEAGMSLQGWELKAIRAGRANIIESYAVIRDGELYLFGAQITPLTMASSHVVADAMRTRKLLLHRNEIDELIGRVQRDGYTLVPTALYWKGNKVKAELALAKGKQSHDKREASKDRDWARDKQRVMRAHNKNA
jgi:SsrA-binding protein